jgi:hypothetical protein
VFEWTLRFEPDTIENLTPRERSSMHVYTVSRFYDEYVGSTAWHVKDETGRVLATLYDENLAYRVRRLLIESDHTA